MSLKCSTWMQSQKWQNNLCPFPRQTFNITVIQVYAPTSNAEETDVEQFYEDLQDLLERANTQKRCSFHYRGLECKSRKSRDTWSNRQIWPWGTKWSRSKANRVCQENTLVITNTLFQQHKRHGHHQMVNTKIRLIIFFAAKDGEAQYSQHKQDWELTVTQSMKSLLPNSDLNWRKQGKPLGRLGMT